MPTIDPGWLQPPQTRAAAIRDILIESGVQPSRVQAKAMGKKNPVAVNITATGRRKNNRVLFIVKSYRTPSKSDSAMN